MALVNLEIRNVHPFADGITFGNVGAYQLLEGKAQFSVDPSSSSNKLITDLNLVPPDEKGRVAFTSDFAMLQPTDPSLGNGRILLDVLNRGRKTVLSGLNSAPTVEDSQHPLHPVRPFPTRTWS